MGMGPIIIIAPVLMSLSETKRATIIKMTPTSIKKKPIKSSLNLFDRNMSMFSYKYWKITLTRRVSAIKTIDKTKRTLTDFVSVPKTIGKGPIINAPPPLTFFSLSAEERSMRTIETKTATKPVKKSTNPNVTNESESIIEIHHFLSKRIELSL